MAPKETTLHVGIVRLLLHFRWTWIGLIVSDDNEGEGFVRNLTPVLVQNSICVAFLQRAGTLSHNYSPLQEEKLLKINSTLALTVVNVIVVSGNSKSLEMLQYVLVFNELNNKIILGKVWIMPPQWDFTSSLCNDRFCTVASHGALSFSVSTNAVPAFVDFLWNLKPNESLMHFLCFFWQLAFMCSLHNGTLDFYEEKCTGEEKLESLPSVWLPTAMTAQSYSIYNAVYAVAHALHSIHVSRERTVLNRGRFEHLTVHPWQVKQTL